MLRIVARAAVGPESTARAAPPVVRKARRDKIIAASNLKSLGRCGSLRLDPQFLDDRPPPLGIGLHKRAECLRCLSLARKNFHSEIGETRSHRRIGQCLDGSRIELAYDVVW